MKIYQVTLSYFDGDHDHGSYRSPLFANRKDAENFLAQITNKEDWEKFWYTEEDWDGTAPLPEITEIEISTAPVVAENKDLYLEVTYT